MSNGNINDIKRDRNDLWFWNTDISVEPAVITIGTKGRDSSGNWRYTLVSGDGANFVRSEDAGLMRVSSVGSTSIALSGDAAGNRVSAIQADATNLMVSAKSNDAALFRVSSIGGSLSLSGDAAGNRVSAVQADAANLMVSAKSDSAALFRVSALGVTLASAQALSATLKEGTAFVGSVSANQAGTWTISALAKEGTAFIGNVSAKNTDAANFNVSAKSGDAALLRMSAIISTTPNVGVLQLTSPWVTQASFNNTDAAYGVVSAVQHDAGQLLVSAKSDSAGQLRISAFSNDAANFNVSAKSIDAGTFLLSAKSGDAGQLLTSAIVTGNVAAAATDSGNPVKVGGKLNTTLPTYTDGQRGDLQIGTRGSLNVQVMGQNSTNAVATLADNADNVAAASTVNTFKVLNRNTVFNGSQWDRQPGDVTGTYVVPKAHISGANVSRYWSQSISSTQLIKSNAAGAIYHIDLSLISASTPCIVHIYDVSAAPVLGTSTPAMTFVLSGAGAQPVRVDYPYGVNFTNGIGIAATSANANNATTVMAASSVMGQIIYK
jgi:hypothetical protein